MVVKLRECIVNLESWVWHLERRHRAHRPALLGSKPPMESNQTDPIPIFQSIRSGSGHTGRAESENKLWISLNVLHKPTNLLRYIFHVQLSLVWWLFLQLYSSEPQQLNGGRGKEGRKGGGAGLSHYSCFVGIWSSCQAHDTDCSNGFRMTSLHYSTLFIFQLPLFQGLWGPHPDEQL